MPPESQVVDARGLKCPLPVLKMEKALDHLLPGAELVVLATDPIAKLDIPLFCRQHGYTCSMTTDGDMLRFTVGRA